MNKKHLSIGDKWQFLFVTITPRFRNEEADIFWSTISFRLKGTKGK